MGDLTLRLLWIIITIFLLLFLVELGLYCCSLAFSSCGEWGLLLVVVSRFPIAGASLV